MSVKGSRHKLVARQVVSFHSEQVQTFPRWMEFSNPLADEIRTRKQTNKKSSIKNRLIQGDDSSVFIMQSEKLT